MPPILSLRGLLVFMLLFMASSAIVPRERARPTPSPPPRPLYLESPALLSALQKLSRYSLRTQDQGVRIESLDGLLVTASHNPQTLFNPASVVKVATSFLALVKLGPEYRFTTELSYRGSWDRIRETIHGDLHVVSDGDPLLREGDARLMAARLRRCGVREVAGDLVVRGPLCLNGNFSLDRSAQRFHDILRAGGIRVAGQLRLEDSGLSAAEIDRDRSDPWIVQHRSPRLTDILWYTNAFSVNVIADRLGASLGGPAELESFLRQALRLPPEEIYFTKTSGLDANGLSPRATVGILRGLYYFLQDQGMELSDIMPAAGVDRGTLATRLNSKGLRGCVVAKTGTQTSWDQGVSALAGMIYTEKGPFFMAIFNSHGDVNFYRHWQDRFLGDLILELGGGRAPGLSHKEPPDIYNMGTIDCRREDSPAVSELRGGKPGP